MIILSMLALPLIIIVLVTLLPVAIVLYDLPFIMVIIRLGRRRLHGVDRCHPVVLVPIVVVLFLLGFALRLLLVT